MTPDDTACREARSKIILNKTMTPDYVEGFEDGFDHGFNAALTHAQAAGKGVRHDEIGKAIETMREMRGLGVEWVRLTRTATDGSKWEIIVQPAQHQRGGE